MDARETPPDREPVAPDHLLPPPCDDQIRIRAYERYVARGHDPASADEDWHAARRELEQLRNPKPRPGRHAE